MPFSVPGELTEHGGSDIWGVSPYTLALAANAIHTGEWESVRRQYEVHVLTTNYDPGWEPYRQGLEVFCDRWLTPPLDRAVVFAGPDTAATFFAGAAYFDTPSEIANVLINGQELVTDAETDEPAVMPRRDFKGYVESETTPRILRSLDLIQPVPDGYLLNRSIFEQLAVGFDMSRARAAGALVLRLLEALNIDSPCEILPPLLNTVDIEPPDEVPDRGALPVLVRHHDLDALVETLFSESFEEVVDELYTERQEELSKLDKARCLGYESSETVSPAEWPLDSAEAGVCAIASQRGVPVAAAWLSERLGQSPLSIVDDLSESGISVSYRSGLLHFGQAYQIPSPGDAAIDAYTDWLSARSETLRRQSEALAQLGRPAEGLWQRQRESVVTAAISALEDWTVSPTRFVYTVFDPDHHADEYDIEQYVGPSDDLEQEIDEIREWRRDRRHDTESFAELVPEVVSYPLENPDVNDHVRIMCPWTNFAIQDYTALFQRLLDNEVTVQLLMRLPSSREWNNLKSNLLTRLGDTKGNLELRSYTRYKQFRDHAELRELDEKTEQRQRTGIHAKLFIAGEPANGNVLAGSANLMENSLFYNPEAGIQTRNPNVIAAAIDYFDLVWRLASPDRISEEAYTGDTEYRFFPRVYQPQ